MLLLAETTEQAARDLWSRCDVVSDDMLTYLDHYGI